MGNEVYMGRYIKKYLLILFFALLLFLIVLAICDFACCRGLCINWEVDSN